MGSVCCDMGTVYFLKRESQLFSLIKLQTLGSWERRRDGVGGEGCTQPFDIKPISPILFCGLIGNMIHHSDETPIRLCPGKKSVGVCSGDSKYMRWR